MARGKKNGNGNSKKLNSQQLVNSAIKSICDIMRRSNCAGAMQYVPELTWQDWAVPYKGKSIKKGLHHCKPLTSLVAGRGFEPLTFGL